MMPNPADQEPTPLVSDLAATYATGCPSARDEGAVHAARLPDGHPAWLVTGYADVKTLLADPRLSLNSDTSRHGYRGFGLPPALNANLLNLDGDDHARVRRLVSRAFTPRRTDALRERIEQLTTDLLDAITPTGRGDLVADFAARLPVAVICDLLGIPDSDGATFQTFTRSLLNPNDPNSPPARDNVAAMYACLLDLIARKRSEPADDLLTAMIAARDGNDRLTENELLSLAFLILWAGFETTVHLIAAGLGAVLTDRRLADIVRTEPNPHTNRMSALIEELLRRDGPMLVSIRRFAVEDLRIGENCVPAGDTVLLALAAANRDPEHIPTPDQIDLNRPGTNHLGFGHGPHYCLGAPLARMEVRTALWTALHHLPDLTLAFPDRDLSWRTNSRHRTLTALPVTFTAQPTQ